MVCVRSFGSLLGKVSHGKRKMTRRSGLSATSHTACAKKRNLQRCSFVQISVAYCRSIMNHMTKHLQVSTCRYFTDFMHAVMM